MNIPSHGVAAMALKAKEINRHKPNCTVTEASFKLEILDLSRRGIVLSE